MQFHLLLHQMLVKIAQRRLSSFSQADKWECFNYSPPSKVEEGASCVKLTHQEFPPSHLSVRKVMVKLISSPQLLELEEGDKEGTHGVRVDLPTVPRLGRVREVTEKLFTFISLRETRKSGLEQRYQLCHLQ